MVIYRTSQESDAVARPASGQSLSRSATVSNDKSKNTRCWNCDKAGYVARECQAPRQESTGWWRRLTKNANALPQEKLWFTQLKTQLKDKLSTSTSQHRSQWMTTNIRRTWCTVLKKTIHWIISCWTHLIQRMNQKLGKFN